MKMTFELCQAKKKKKIQRTNSKNQNLMVENYVGSLNSCLVPATVPEDRKMYLKSHY